MNHLTPQFMDNSSLGFKQDRRGAQRPDVPVRRRGERLYGPCVALVRGVDAEGEVFTESTVLQNVSAGGLYVNLQRDVRLGTRLFVVFSFSPVALQNVPVPRVAAHGEVRRVDALDAKARGVGIQFQHHRFL